MNLLDITTAKIMAENHGSNVMPNTQLWYSLTCVLFRRNSRTNETLNYLQEKKKKIRTHNADVSNETIANIYIIRPIQHEERTNTQYTSTHSPSYTNRLLLPF